MICALLDTCLPERHPYGELYQRLKILLNQLIDNNDWPRHYALFELNLLSSLGFGLDLSECAVTKKTGNLAYVSPKTGRAVCENVRRPYAERLFILPKFLMDEGVQPTPKDIYLALNMTGYFLSQFVLEGKKLPEIRQRLLSSFCDLKILECA